MSKIITPLIVLAVILTTVVFAVLKHEPSPFKEDYANSKRERVVKVETRPDGARTRDGRTTEAASREGGHPQSGPETGEPDAGADAGGATAPSEPQSIREIQREIIKNAFDDGNGDGQETPEDAEPARKATTTTESPREAKTETVEKRPEPPAPKKAEPRSEDDLPTLDQAMLTASARRHTAPEPARSERSVRRDGPWRVQAGAYSNRDRADKVGRVLREMGVTPEITPIYRDGGTLYRVRTPVMNGEDARRVESALENKGIPAKLLR